MGWCTGSLRCWWGSAARVRALLAPRPPKVVIFSARPAGCSSLEGARAATLALRSQLPSQLSSQCFLARILHRQQDTLGVSGRLVLDAEACELAVGGQFALLEQRPHLARKLGFQQLGREAAERTAKVVDVTFEHRERPVVARRVHRL